MYKLKKNGKVFTSKFVGTGPSSYEKRIYRAGRGLTKVEKHCRTLLSDKGQSVNSCGGPFTKKRYILLRVTGRHHKRIQLARVKKGRLSEGRREWSLLVCWPM